MLETLLAQIGPARICCVWNLEHEPGAPKPTKVPVHPVTVGARIAGHRADSQDPAIWMTGAEALAHVRAGRAYGVALVLSPTSEYFLIDLDNSAIVDAEGNVTGWLPLAHEICAMFPGCAVEISNSGRGLHVLGKHAPIPEHRTQKKTLKGLEVYSRLRFVALTGTALQGDINTDATVALQAVIAKYLPEPVGARDADWTDTPYEGWRGGGTDEQIVHAMLNRRTPGAIFGSQASFADLWNADADALAKHFPADPNSRSGLSWNGSAADQALANHVAYATGYNCEATLRILMQSPLRRDKWERDDYLYRTIIRAVAGKREDAEEKARQGRRVIDRAGETFNYNVPPPPPPAPDPAPAPPAPPPPPQALYVDPATGAGVTTTGILFDPAPKPPREKLTHKNVKSGTFVTRAEMNELFEGHVYIQDVNGIVLDNGEIADQKQFNNRHGGRSFQLTAEGKSTKSAWEAFIDNEVEAMPKADIMTFDPKLASGYLDERDGLVCFNSYVALKVPMVQGDVSLFLDHIAKLFPYGNDREILICYFAALVQYKGYKFSWAPLLQGVPGNGKTFLSKAMEHCLGARYTHHARASTLGSNFNAAFYGKLLVCIEDVHISENKSSVWEALKPMITADRMEIEGKGLNQVNRDVCFNFVLDSNHKGALRKTEDDRRIAPFFAAQQRVTDLARCGMDKTYFVRLWDWAKKEGGFAAIHHYLAHYPIPDALNPATECIRAPTTTSTDAAITASRGSVEQEVIEAIDSGAEGFRDGWVNSVAFDRLLREMGRSRALPREQRKQLLIDFGFEPHPELPNGRVIHTLADGTRPILYLKPSHAAYGMAPAEATAAYLASQAPRK